MLGTDYRTGSPNWIDLGSPDIPRAAAFYRAVFGWEFQLLGPETGGYGFFQIDGKTVGAVGQLDPGASSAWTVYFQSEDVDATTKGVRDGGGTVRVEPMDVMGEGWLAQYTDQQGADFAIWKPTKTPGLGVTSADNTLCWVELHVPDPLAAVEFYGTLFGMRSQDMDAPGMTYRVLSIADGDQQDGSFGGVAPLMEGETNARWVPYFAVADVDAVVGTARTSGGTVLMPGADVPDVGRIAWLADPSGAVFALLKPNPRAN
ncbi:VOC family protein [Streptomyces sp. NBC_00503]|uniref:VOC family protein n=1 Tax=Streptomyces sp. NBC_00503 TaxID=2903659 RepID=UPI002E8064C5|nr:VOC family protein [Streptomyces sp. NBC_00503]WUD79366.1 VOC family protein [Streptomyces sp. NBC_00503]